MQAIINEYDYISKNFIENSNFDPERKQTEYEISELLREKINSIIVLSGVNIEIVGCWLWLDGNTFEHKEILKEEDFKWNRKRYKWYWHEGNFRKSKNDVTFNEMREFFGSTKIEQTKQII
ncbi:MAG: hypothetical protein HN704_01890 [Bacteroidetes bacterium]|jgi:hypothetical protein|nr:hypothetical protein [Bacteroidota bacterium]MBT6688085.1 hypothetical protein [Bacteroidota bacterium]MBT7144518.1 hypothetical protein [Bacteroidota bacterium]MBT7490337.1 hypothetical protein [Bacteroidota bacterium]